MMSLRNVVVVALAAMLLCSVALAGPKNVIVVMNGSSEDSIAVAKYYASKRGIDRKYICKIYCSSAEEIPDAEFEKTIRGPIKDYLMKSGLKGTADYIVLTKGIPIRTAEKWGVDSALTCPFNDYSQQQPNPYFDAGNRFSHKRYQIYLVTRLDGLTVADAKRLVDNSLKARAKKGLFLLDIAPQWDNKPGYKMVNDSMRGAASALKKRGYTVDLDEGKDFAVKSGLMGYYSWGSNDGRFSLNAYHKLRFEPGAIAELAQSTSAYTLTSKRTLDGDRSYVTDLVAQGVTGVSGYVYEPYTTALAAADILFDRYTNGYNLAESFYAASRYIHWRGLVLGDPLCAPYAD